MKISAIKSQRSHDERVNVHVDGAFSFAVAREILFRAGVQVGDEINESQIFAIEREDLGWRAREAGLNLLSYRPRSATELRQRLLRKDFPADVADQCVAELVEKGLVDDSAFAESFVRDRVRFNPRGSRRLVQELRAKGVDADTASAAVSEVMEGHETSELELAREVAAKWSPRSGEEPLRARRRLYGLLARRGFGGETVRQIMDETEFT